MWQAGHRVCGRINIKNRSDLSMGAVKAPLSDVLLQELVAKTRLSCCAAAVCRLHSPRSFSLQLHQILATSVDKMLIPPSSHN